MDETGETQVSLSDPDARSMATTARMPRVVGYNVQTAFEAENHLIVAHEVTMLGYDRDALSMMAAAAKDKGEMKVLAVTMLAFVTLTSLEFDDRDLAAAALLIGQSPGLSRWRTLVAFAACLALGSLVQGAIPNLFKYYWIAATALTAEVTSLPRIAAVASSPSTVTVVA